MLSFDILETVKVVPIIDPAIESLIALELSKLQLTQGDMDDLNVNNGDNDAIPPAVDAETLNINSDEGHNEQMDENEAVPTLTTSEDVNEQIQISPVNGNEETCNTSLFKQPRNFQ
ncbi:hypothetical protein CEXT_716641 [Caerostris extrusa]|uniref:Uncharacterized protein n=1 Tax=Caerostris extrusa TaxID=172846 RepID=A0AAV4MKT0_CAEEX|nr:hypothetical protein CEXT_716641 [Caerostris extrusa]